MSNIARCQILQITDIANDKYVISLTNDDIKHILAFYRSKHDSFQIVYRI